MEVLLIIPKQCEENMEDNHVIREGRLVRLRPLDKRHDLSHFLKWLNDPEVTQFVGSNNPVMRSQEEAWFDRLGKGSDEQIVFAIETLKGKKLIGNIGLHRIHPINRTAASGTIIGEKEYWGKGYGTDAKMLQLAFAFLTLNLRQVGAAVIGFNERSHRYLMGCGYKEVGRRDGWHFRNGTYYDEILLSVSREDWLPLWETYLEELKG
ncbi:hypothetical protein CL654_02470 [bacterium]|nr:hypothetical protein [bacterium]|tara:strand:- start:3245 stop:3868 length:624 start_codon:yes stop_codon:yes gene_type:complete